MTRRQLKDHKDYILEQLTLGITCSALGEELGFHRNSIARFATENGFRFTKVVSTGRKLIPHKEYILSELRRGRSARSLGQEFGCAHTTVRNMAKEHGIDISRSIDQNKDEIIDLYETGLSVDDISLVTGRATSTIYDGLKRWGVETRAALGSKEALDKMSLNDLKSNWVDIDKPYVVTVGRRPKFYLIPIER